VRIAVVAIAVAIAAIIVVAWPAPDHGGVRIVYSLEVDPETRKAALDRAVATVRERIDELDGVGETAVYKKGDEIVVEIGGVEHGEVFETRALIENPMRVEFKIVDNDAPYMRKLFGLVTSDMAARILSDIDSWQPDEGPRQVDYYLRADDRVAIEQYIATAASVDPAYAVPADREIVYEHVVGDGKPYWRSYYVARTAALSGDDIARAEKSIEPSTNQPIVLIDFGRAGTEKFGELTAANVGKKLATIVGGQVASAPIINAPIRGGRASIAMGAGDPDKQAREADALVAVLKSGSLPAPLVVRSLSEVAPLRPDRPRRRWGFALLVVGAAGLFVGWDLWRRRGGRNPPEPRPATS
jgi:protein-export membrane protein SecD